MKIDKLTTMPKGKNHIIFKIKCKNQIYYLFSILNETRIGFIIMCFFVCVCVCLFTRFLPERLFRYIQNGHFCNRKFRQIGTLSEIDNRTRHRVVYFVTHYPIFCISWIQDYSLDFLCDQ